MIGAKIGQFIHNRVGFGHQVLNYPINTFNFFIRMASRRLTLRKQGQLSLFS